MAARTIARTETHKLTCKQVRVNESYGDGDDGGDDDNSDDDDDNGDEQEDLKSFSQQRAR